MLRKINDFLTNSLDYVIQAILLIPKMIYMTCIDILLLMYPFVLHSKNKEEEKSKSNTLKINISKIYIKICDKNVNRAIEYNNRMLEGRLLVWRKVGFRG